MPINVELVDGGTAGLNLLPLLDGCGSVILVDGVLMKKDPGHVQWYSIEDVVDVNNDEGATVVMSTHEMDLGQTLRYWHEHHKRDPAPDVSVVGISIRELDMRFSAPSHAVMSGIDTAVDEITRFVWTKGGIER